MGHHYPFASNDRLTAAELGVTFELSRSVVPPSGLAGGAMLGKQWLDISVAPPALRIVAVNQAATTYVASDWATMGSLDTANHQFNYSGGWAGNLNITGNIIRMDGCPPSAGTVGAGGPLIYADQTGFVVKQGTSNAGILLLNNTGGQDALLSSQGLYILNKLIVNTVTNPVAYNFMYAPGGRQSISLGDNITINRAPSFEWDTPDPINLMTLDNTTGLYVHHNAVVAATLLVGGTITTNQGFIFLNGANNTSKPGPAMQGDDTNIAFRCGPGNGEFILYNYAGIPEFGVQFSNGNATANGTMGAANFFTSGYIYLNGSNIGSGVVGNGGPLIFADANNFVVKMGSGNGSFQVLNYAGNVSLFSVSDGGVATIAQDCSVGRWLGVGGNIGGIAINAGNGNINCANDIIANGVFRQHLLGGGTKGARVECWAGDWDSMQFGMTTGHLSVSPDGGTSGFIFNSDSSYSDVRLKDNIRDTDVDALEILRQTPVRAFEWNAKGRELMPWAGSVECGLVAQELEETIPLAVSISPIANDTRVINDASLTPYIIRALQQIADRLDAGGL
jgi:hypothetical protein